MKKLIWLLAVVMALLSSCQAAKTTVTILADGQTFVLTSSATTPAEILSEARIKLGTNDCVFFLGSLVPLSSPLPDVGPYTLAVRRAATLNIVAPGVQKEG